jgi:hypothetical protein
LTGGIWFVNFNSPFTVILPDQVLQHESVAAKLDYGVPGSVWQEVASLLLMRLVNRFRAGDDSSAPAGFRRKNSLSG